MPTFMLGNLVPKYFHTFLDEASSQEWSLKVTCEQIKSSVIDLEPSYKNEIIMETNKDFNPLI